VMAPSNKRMQLTKRGILWVGVQDGLVFIESRFAADPRCSADAGTVFGARRPADDRRSNRLAQPD